MTNLTNFKHVKVKSSSITFTPRARQWCKLPYPNHPGGCPNYGKNSLCPPAILYQPGILKKYDELQLVYCKFDIQSYITEFKKEHADWTLKQLRNPLYWQGSIKKSMKAYILDHFYQFDILGAGSGFWDRPSMEAVGINVFKTLRDNGIEFDPKAIKTVTMVSLVMVKKRKSLLDF